MGYVCEYCSHEHLDGHCDRCMCEQIRIYRDALSRIAGEITCMGPSCIWCETDAHPSSNSAIIAQDALKRADKVNMSTMDFVHEILGL